MRRIINMTVGDARLVGTMHEPRGQNTGIGLLLLNAGPLPRSWDSGLAVDIAERLADDGVATFRIDLPGLGDSTGEIPELVEQFRLGVNSGRNDEAVRAMASELRRNHGVKTLILGGLCSGAISSLRAAAQNPRDYAGVIMLEPDFRGPIPPKPAPNAQGTDETPAKPPKLPLKKRLAKKFGRSSIEQGTWLGPLRPALIWLIVKTLGRQLPPDVEPKLVNAWRGILGARVPQLLVRAERGFDWRVRRIIQALPSRAVARSMRSVVVAKTNHMFTGGDGQTAALREVVGWVGEKYLGKPPRVEMEPPTELGVASASPVDPPPQTCGKCGYDLAGIRVDNCPECGNSVHQPKPPRTCDECDYDLTGTQGDVCPECGASTLANRKMSKSVVRSSAWTLGGHAASQVVRFVSSLILTRLLQPTSYGVMGLVNTFLQGLQMFSDIGIKPSIIQSNRGDDPVFLNTAWTIGALRGSMLWLVACGAAWPLSVFYGQPALMWLIPVTAISAFISGFNSTSLATANRKLALGKITAIEVLVQIINAVAVMAWAFFDPSPWALAIGALTNAVAYLFLSHFWLPSIKHRFTCDRQSAKQLIKFGRWVFLSTAVTFLAMQLDRIILGKLTTMEALGVYILAMTLSQMPSQVFEQLVTKVVFPTISLMINRGTFDATVVNGIRTRMLLPIAIGCAAICVAADPTVHVLYRSEYWEAGLLLSILAVRTWIGMIAYTYGGILLGVGKPKEIFYATLTKTVIFASASFPAFTYWQVPGIAYAVCLAEVGALVVMELCSVKLKVAIPMRELGLTAIGVAYAAAMWGLKTLVAQITPSPLAAFLSIAAVTSVVCLWCLRSMLKHLHRTV